MDDGLLGDCGLGFGCVQLRQFLNIVLQQDSSYSSFFIKLAGTLKVNPDVGSTMIVLTGQSLHPAGLRFLAVWGSGVRGRGSGSGLGESPPRVDNILLQGAGDLVSRL